MTINETYEINKAFKIVDAAKKSEKIKNFKDAARGYREAKKIFKKYDSEKMRYVKCLIGHYINGIKYYLDGRDIETGASKDGLKEYMDNIVQGIENAELSRFDKCELLISAYGELERVFDENSKTNYADEMNYQRMKLYSRYYWEKAKNEISAVLKIRNISRALISKFLHIFHGHGARPVRAFLIIGVYIALFSSMFYCFGLVEYAASPDKMISCWQCFYFTIITFTSVGYGDVIPKGENGQAAAIVAAILGYLMFSGVVSMFFSSGRR